MASKPERLPKHEEMNEEIMCSQKISVDKLLHESCHKFTLEIFLVIKGGLAIHALYKWSAVFSSEQINVNQCVIQF